MLIVSFLRVGLYISEYEKQDKLSTIYCKNTHFDMIAVYCTALASAQ